MSGWQQRVVVVDVIVVDVFVVVVIVVVVFVGYHHHSVGSGGFAVADNRELISGHWRLMCLLTLANLQVR